MTSGLTLEDISISDDAPNEKPKHSFKWMIIAIDRTGNGIIIDADNGFYDCDMFDGNDAEDNAIYLPEDETPGLHLVTDVEITYSTDWESGQVDGFDIDGTWKLLCKTDDHKPSLEAS